MTTTTTQDEARQALAEAGRSERRSLSLYAYRLNAPLLMLWGAIWIAVYGSSAASPEAALWAWPIAGPVGMIITAAYFWRYGRPSRAEPNHSRAYFWRLSATWALNALFFILAGAVLAPWEWREPHALIGLALGALYGVFGCWYGWRLVPIGYALTAISMIAYFWIPPASFLLVFGLSGGATMLLGGLWLRFIR